MTCVSFLSVSALACSTAAHMRRSRKTSRVPDGDCVKDMQVAKLELGACEGVLDVCAQGL
jgi:hypothetical protein